MNLLLLIMRLLHILLGVFWVGTMLFNVVFLIPAINDAGPDGAKVGLALARRRFMDVMPFVGLLTIISGLWLYWKVSGGFQPGFMRSGMSVMLGVGATVAVVAFVLGVAVMRPAMMRAGALAQSAAQASAAEREAQLATAQALRRRAARMGQVVAALLTVTVAAMALARYL